MLLPSRGCQTCRDRRVKCDEATPICLRCVKSNRICNGMDDSLVIHIENSYASGRQKRPKGPRRRSMAGSRSSRDTGLRCSLMDLRKLEIVNLSVSTIALTVFSRTRHKPGIALEATQTYHRLLQISRKALLSLDLENIDSCLMAIFLMGRYEDSVHTRTSNVESPFIATVRSSFHHDGALAVLKAWKYRMSHIQVATDIIKHTRRGIIRSALMRNLELPFWLLDGLIPEYLVFNRHDVKSAPLFNELQGHSQLVFTYSDPTYATVWNQYFAMKILVKSTCVRILTIMPDKFQLNGSGSMCTLHSSDNMAAENVRPCLADLVIWPLTVVSSIKDVDDDARSWFRARLARAGRITGTGLLECAETGQWLEL
ncbi:hypothetical protein B0O99DRAFT_612340 [Bisporella sp. PMI_857]|nr:hypothetical protein B0O99DRAFT_612340 [Bisporella sp. PMI_857]